jgi:hypothetical protein
LSAKRAGNTRCDMMHRWLARTVVLAAFVLTPVFAAAQSALTAADAGSFLGTWTLTLESPQGASSRRWS